MIWTCGTCGSAKGVIGHHDDYARPDDTRPLCGKCHSAWHREHGPGANRHLSAMARRPRRYSLMLTMDEHAGFRRAACAAGMDLAAWFRQLARRASGTG